MHLSGDPAADEPAAARSVSGDAAGIAATGRIEGAARGLLRGIAQLSQALFRAGEFGYTRSQVSVLDALESGPCRVTALAVRTGMAQPRVTVILQQLQEAGLVERRRCADDRRAVETTLTDAGHALMERGRQRMAVALLGALDGGVEDSERAVAAARAAIMPLVDALHRNTVESEAS
ncbi:MarR family winged helix-turn-helix transcriptional regulator [Streptomyces sp. VRA16 Mangrove soil]|uniref:MarR family winged helix-turn-helix transcriptional regulator n=1 Tax=Streptomyces sp. VRA16 Mangrove soil TaxID=2817434 RepID=UPI001A9F277D|nr:MarR family winged helix-turn-helix transcriptional regulator [Streptomyces sp. VRA16 Mangrove soil]MBO1332862.1 winged helix-turn-helix transcriptional regulator [Streptomyces sp. VRA16 Mangrove soil]